MNLPFRKPAAAAEAPTESDLDVRVALANPLPNERLALLALPELVTLRDQIATSGALILPRAVTWRSRRVFRPLVLSAVLLLAAFGGIYGAWSAHTGWFGAPGFTESDTSEWLRQDSPEIVGVVDKLTAKYTLPPGGSWNGLRKSFPRGPGYIQVTGIEGEVSMDAYCQWQHYWIVGYDTQDPAKMSAAQTVLDQFPDWPISRKTGDPSAIAQWRQIADYARTNQAAPLEHLYSLNCGGAITGP